MLQFLRIVLPSVLWDYVNNTGLIFKCLPCVYNIDINDPLLTLIDVLTISSIKTSFYSANCGSDFINSFYCFIRSDNTWVYVDSSSITLSYILKSAGSFLGSYSCF